MNGAFGENLVYFGLSFLKLNLSIWDFPITYSIPEKRFL